MNVAEKSLDAMMRNAVCEGGFSVSGGRGLFMEVMEKTTRRVWMSAAPVSLLEFERLALDESLVKVGVAMASMDQAAFHWSPGAPDEPVLERVINGRLYINVATPAPPNEWLAPAEEGGPVEITVDKAHIIGFEAGRSVVVLSLAEGDFVEVVGEPKGDETLVLPAGGAIRQVLLEQPWLIELPSPTRAFFWLGDSMRSFQGPVTLP